MSDPYTMKDHLRELQQWHEQDRSRIADLESQLAAANARVEEQREAVRVLAGVFSDMNHHASCGNYDNGVENNGADEGDVMHVLFMEDCYRRAISNPIAKAAIGAAKKGGG